MRPMFHLPCLTGVLLLAAAPFAGAQSPLPDPVAPAVIGRPLDEIKPAREKSATLKLKRANQVTAASLAVAKPAPAAVAATPAAVQPVPAPQHAAKQALDDRADPRAQIVDNVGKGTHIASKPLAPGAYLGSRTQALVRKYYETHPAAGQAATWKIGEPVPKKATLAGVPDNLRAALPRVPPGHQYVQLDGEVVLVAVQSRMVVDGISRSAR